MKDETILIVDDEEPVRRTFQEWLTGAGLDCTILTAPDAEAALKLANRHVIDLAILDWALGAGDDGLQLLQDLYEFNPHVIAIMVTGFANQATPLDAMRMGVRDYLDKNQDLSRDTFLRAVRKQLDAIRPAKRERRLHDSLVAFREAVEKIVPLVQSAAALNDPVPLPDAVSSLLRFLIVSTHARDGVLLVRRYSDSDDPPEMCRVYDRFGKVMEVPLVPFARSLAATVVSLQEPRAMYQLDKTNVELHPFERGRQSLLAAPLSIAPGIHVVFELFDKQEGEFSENDRRLIQAAAEFGAELLRQALAGRQTNQVLLDAVAAALGASESVAQTLRSKPAERLEQPPAPAILEQLRAGLSATRPTIVPSEESVRLAEAVRELALRHGPVAVQHCIRLVESLRQLLDTISSP
jgi:two-component system, NtrC family, nitrogen regulation response regulator NtrX